MNQKKDQGPTIKLNGKDIKNADLKWTLKNLFENLENPQGKVEDYDWRINNQLIQEVKGTLKLSAVEQTYKIATNVWNIGCSLKGRQTQVPVQGSNYETISPKKIRDTTLNGFESLQSPPIIDNRFQSNISNSNTKDKGGLIPRETISTSLSRMTIVPDFKRKYEMKETTSSDVTKTIHNKTVTISQKGSKVIIESLTGDYCQEFTEQEVNENEQQFVKEAINEVQMAKGAQDYISLLQIGSQIGTKVQFFKDYDGAFISWFSGVVTYVKFLVV